MAYIGKSIESGTFSVLDTSGNTYNGSNTTFSLGTQVGSPAQLLVSHDGVIQKPGTDYTLASGGTQITFTTAPASGASIFIVEISGAVGGPLDADLNGTELILDTDGDTSIHADTDDRIDIKIAGADDFKFTANNFNVLSGSTLTIDSGATITNSGTANGFGTNPDGAQVFNESGASVDFRVESDGNVNAFIVDGSADRVGFGIAAPETEMHIQSTSGECELRLTAASTSDARLRFGDTDDTDAGYIGYSRDTGKMTFSSLNSSGAHFQIHNNGFLKIGAGTSIPTDTTFPITINAIKDGNYVEELIIKNTSSQSVFGKRIYIDQYAPDNTSSEFMNFRDTGGERFRVFSDGDVQNHDNSYGSISDERIKQNITDSGSQWDDIKALKVRKYKKKDDVRQYGDKAWEQIGVIAQELEASGMNKLVEESPPTSFDIESDSAFGTLYTESDKDENGNLPPEKNIGDIKEVKANVKGVKYSILYMKAIKALQEAMARIETLETKVKALEG